MITSGVAKSTCYHPGMITAAAHDRITDRIWLQYIFYHFYKSSVIIRDDNIRGVAKIDLLSFRDDNTRGQKSIDTKPCSILTTSY